MNPFPSLSTDAVSFKLIPSAWTQNVFSQSTSFSYHLIFNEHFRFLHIVFECQHIGWSFQCSVTNSGISAIKAVYLKLTHHCISTHTSVFKSVITGLSSWADINRPGAIVGCWHCSPRAGLDLSLQPTSHPLPCSLCCSLGGLQAVHEPLRHLLLRAQARSNPVSSSHFAAHFLPLCKSPRAGVSLALGPPLQAHCPSTRCTLFCITSYTFTSLSVLPL